MKKLFVCILAVMPLFFASCEQKNDVSNPSQGGETSPQDEVGWEVTMHAGDWITIKNTSVARLYDGKIVGLHNDVFIVSFGEVNSLNEINYVPTTGWKNEMDIEVGHGYLLKSESNRYYYCRLRVLERIDKGGAVGYRIRIHDSWDPILSE